MTEAAADLWADLDALFDGVEVAAAPLVVQPFEPPAVPAAALDVTGRRKVDRDALVDEALKAAAQCLTVIRDTFESKGADFDDACKALPLLHRVLEHVEKLDAAQKAGAAWPVVNFSIVLDDNVPQDPPPRRKRAVATGIDKPGAAHG